MTVLRRIWALKRPKILNMLEQIIERFDKTITSPSLIGSKAEESPGQGVAEISGPLILSSLLNKS